MSRDRSKYPDIDRYLGSIPDSEAKEILRAVMYGFAGQTVSRNKAVAFIGGSKKFLDKMTELRPEICLGRRNTCRKTTMDYDVFTLIQCASIVRK